MVAINLLKHRGTQAAGRTPQRAPLLWVILTWGIAVLRAPGLVFRFAGSCPPRGARLVSSALYVLALVVAQVLPYLLVMLLLWIYSLADAAYDGVARRLSPNLRARQQVPALAEKPSTSLS